MTTREWAQYLDTAELSLIRRTLLRHISDATWCSDEEASTIQKVASELGELITQREVQNLKTAEDTGSWRWPRLTRGDG